MVLVLVLDQFLWFHYFMKNVVFFIVLSVAKPQTKLTHRFVIWTQRKEAVSGPVLERGLVLVLVILFSPVGLLELFDRQITVKLSVIFQ